MKPLTMRNDLLPGTYSAVVTDANGCAAAASADVGFIGTFECVVIPDIITPDPADGYNDEWIIRNIDIYPNAEIKVYSRWGKLIYHTKNPSAEPWKGQVLKRESGTNRFVSLYSGFARRLQGKIWCYKCDKVIT